MENQEKTLFGIVKTVITNERTKQSFEFQTASEIGVEPKVSEGKENMLRVHNQILAIKLTEDIVYGYKLKFKDNVFNFNTMQVVEGGTFDGKKYTGIRSGEVVAKDKFTIDAYSENLNYTENEGYIKWTWKHCKGKPMKWTLKDDKFIIPEFEAVSIPAKGEQPVEVAFVDSLPEFEQNKIQIVGGSKKESNSDVDVVITNNIKWTFKEAINQDDVTKGNFIVKKKSGQKVNGNVTIDETHKIVTFVPTSIEKSTQYIAEAKAINKQNSGQTEAISVEFATK